MNAPLSRFAQRRRGMVLLEVIIALTIFAVVAFSLIMALDAAFGAAEDRNQLEIALRGLNNQLALLHAGNLILGDQDMPDDGTGVLYHVSVAQEQMNDQNNQPVPNMYRVTISAKWTAHGAPDERDISELVYQP
jgi:prepilin-type N-terminal cleavage/methylation domain-containing protein